MKQSDSAFTGSTPAIYQRFMVPMIFTPYAEDMAARAAGLKPQSVLETAAGTGVVTRAVAARLGAKAAMIATDLNPAMLETAAALQGDDSRVTFQQADALALPFADHRFDLVLCQFGVMFFPDKVQGHREARRVLAPGGTYIFAVWDQLSANAFVTVVQEELEARFSENPPHFMLRGPHGYHDVETITSAVRQAGFRDVRLETVEMTARAESARHAATGYCQGNPLRLEIEERAPGKLDEVTEAVAARLASRFGSGPIEGPIRAHIVTASG